MATSQDYNALSEVGVLQKLAKSVPKPAAIWHYPRPRLVATFQKAVMNNADNSQITEVINELEKSPEDRRSYRCLVLANGIRAVLVNDPEADKSAATACVRVGSLKDPWQWQGLAHFCEHMLFLGTEKYPDEGSFLRFINEHGGVRNAITNGEFTRYFFDIAPDHLSEALDRLGQFFTRPLFTESATEREVNAVHSEHSKNIPIDARRLLRLDHHLANPKHDYSKFSTGCLKTLLPDASMATELRSQLLAFHAEHYSANRMTLAVIAKDSLDQLQALTMDAFSAVVNKNLPTNAWDWHPYEGTECGVRVSLVPLRSGQKLEVFFPLTDYTNDYRSAPEHYASHLLGHETAGSLLASLKQRGWANALGTSCAGGAAGYDFFRVSIDLTEEGLVNQDCVLRALFQYIGLLRAAGPQQWIHEELRQLRSLEFRFRDCEPPADAAQRLALRLHVYPMRDLLTARAVITEYRPDLITQVLDQLRPDRCKIFVASKSFEATCPEATSEPFYGVRYRVEPLPAGLMSECDALFAGTAPEAGTSDLRLPEPNPFISSDFRLKVADSFTTEATSPRVLKESRWLRLWHRLDDEFRLQKLCITVTMATPDASADAFAAAGTHLLSMLLNDALNSVLYNAQLAGLSGAVASSGFGLQVSLHGFSEKLPALMETILQQLKLLEIDPVRFGCLLERYQKSLRNHPLEQPLHQCLFNQSVICHSVTWTHQQKLDALSAMTAARVAELARQLAWRQFPVALIYGNASPADALAVADTIQRHLGPGSAPGQPPELLPSRVRDVLLPAGRHHVFRTLTEHHIASACVVYYQTEPAQASLQGHVRQQVLTKLLVQCLKERFFNSLRTQQQLGYMVQLAERQGVTACGLSFGVQSERHPVELEARIDEFVDASKQHLTGMPVELFHAHVQALNTRLVERPKKLSARNARHCGELASGALCFERAERQSELLLNSVSHEDLVQYYKTWIDRNSSQRRKLSLHVISQKTFGGIKNNYSGYVGTVVSDIAQFKSSLNLGPLPVSS